MLIRCLQLWLFHLWISSYRFWCAPCVRHSILRLVKPWHRFSSPSSAWASCDYLLTFAEAQVQRGSTKTVIFCCFFYSCSLIRALTSLEFKHREATPSWLKQIYHMSKNGHYSSTQEPVTNGCTHCCTCSSRCSSWLGCQHVALKLMGVLQSCSNMWHVAVNGCVTCGAQSFYF